MDSKISIHLQDFPDLSFIENDSKLEQDMDLVRVICSTILSIRDLKNLRVRLPLQSLVIIGKNASRIESYSDIITDEVNVKSLSSDDNIDEFADLKLQINFKKVGAKFGSKMKKIIEEARLNNFKIISNNKISICDIELKDDEFDLKLIPKKFDSNKYHIESLPTNDYLIKLDIEVTQDLEEEGVARDLVRIIQQNRKEADLDISDRIKLSFYGDEYLTKIITKYQKYICQQVLANDIAILLQPISQNIIFENEISNKLITMSIAIDNES